MSLKQEKKEEIIRTGDSLRLAREFKRDLLKGEDSTLNELVAAYKAILARLQPRFEKTLTSIALAVTEDGVPPLLVSRRDDLTRMLDDAEGALDGYNQRLAKTVEERQLQLIDIAEANIRDLARAVAGEVEMEWARLSKPYVETLIGVLRPGNPAYDLLMSFAPSTTEKLREAVVSGLAIGQTPEKILKDFEDVLGGNLAQALTVVRTEDMRAYRETQAESLKANADVVIGWRWHASLSYGTCVACLSLHGEVFPLDVDMDSHPNCRCVKLPVLKDVPLEKWETGDEWLRRQDPDIQKRVMGPGKLAAWESGEFALADFRAHKVDKTFGPMYVEIGLGRAQQLRQSRTLRPYVPARFSSDPEGLIAVIRKTGALDNAQSESTVWMRRALVNPATDADAILEQIAKRQGFDGLPLIVSPQEMQHLLRANAARLPFTDSESMEQFIEQGTKGAIPMARNLFPAPAKPSLTPTDFADQFRDGDYFAGKQNRFGSGIYFWPKENPTKDAVMVRAAFRENAKVIHMDQLQKEMKEAGYDDRIPVGYNHGHFAAAKGYDGIMITEDETNIIFVVLNRTALAVEG